MQSKLLLVIGLTSVFSSITYADGAENAGKMAQVIERSADGRAVCSVQRNSRTILCVMRTSDGEADKIARGIVYSANSMDVNLNGWKVTIVTPNDYVVSQRF